MNEKIEFTDETKTQIIFESGEKKISVTIEQNFGENTFGELTLEQVVKLNTFLNQFLIENLKYLLHEKIKQ